MPVSIEEVLGYVPLMKAIRDVPSGVPRPLPAAFYETRAEDRVIGNKARTFRYSGTRRAARIAPYGAPPRQVSLLGRGVQDVFLLHTSEDINFRQEFLNQLLAWQQGSYQAQQTARQEILQQTRDFKSRFDTLRTACVHNTVSTGLLYFDAEGNLLPTSSGAATTIDQGVPAGNRNQLLDSAGNAIITASWASASTDIPSQVFGVVKRSWQLSGEPVKYAIYGQNIPGYIFNNDKAKVYFSYNPQMQRAYAQNTNYLPDGLFGIDKWIPAALFFNEDSGGVIREPFPADNITFAPELKPDTYGVLEGSYLVPKSYQPAGGIEGALGNLEMVYGMFQYARVNPIDLPNAQFVAGDTFLPWLKKPTAWFMADTTP